MSTSLVKLEMILGIVREENGSSESVAVADANRAIELDPAMAKGPRHIYVKGKNLLNIVKAALETDASLASGDSRFINLINECNDKIADASVLRGTADPDKSILAGEDESIAPTGAEKDDEVMPDGPE
ncbi:protein SGT1 homolog [Daucus carota subsp. sativus]|uniref:protein SGT1 homolog n=1 Tax=Daucus carota subsp. sativus TaxID=79200 RepID=UPI0007EF895A|nr:PREDICTED: protein SGT1 homolog [Daucus carota subsp. sativus]